MNTEQPTYTRAQLEAALRRAGDTDTPKDVALLRSWDPLLTISIDQIAASILAAHILRVETGCEQFRKDHKFEMDSVAKNRGWEKRKFSYCEYHSQRCAMLTFQECAKWLRGVDLP
jgi:hypothetical protein